MSREKKVQIIDEFQEIFSKYNIGILTDYRGLSTTELNDLRRKLRESNIEYRVVKNSLAQLAAKRAGRDDLASLFDGPIGIAFSYGDITLPAKALTDHIRTTKSILGIRGGFLETGLLTAANVTTLSTLPSREILISKALAGMQSPIANLISTLASPIRGIVGMLQARIQQLEGE